MVDAALLAARQYRPYFGRAIAALTPISAPGLGDIAVDRYWRLYVDFEWFASLSARLRATLIACHTVEHLLRDHASRGCANADRSLAAADLEINSHVGLSDLQDEALTPQRLGLRAGLLLEEYLQYVDGPESGTCAGGSGAGRPLECELPGTGTPGVDAASAEAIRDAVAADVREANRVQPGTVPAGLVVWAEAREARYAAPWIRLLPIAFRKGIQSSDRNILGARSMSRPSLRAASRGLVLPGPVDVRRRVTVIVDTSGSMSERGSLVKSIVRRLSDDAEIQEIVCDAAASKKSKKSAYRGGGGTDLRKAFDLISANLRPILCVVLSDCETPWPDVKPPFRTLIVRMGDGDPPRWADSVVDVRS